MEILPFVLHSTFGIYFTNRYKELGEENIYPGFYNDVLNDFMVLYSKIIENAEKYS